MSSGAAKVVLEVLRGPMDGARQTIGSSHISVGTAEDDDLTLPGDKDLAGAKLEITVVAVGKLKVTADKPFRIDGDEVEGNGEAKTGSIIGIGATELMVVEVAKDSGTRAAKDGSDAGDADSGVKKCPKCGAANDPNAPWCGNCGRDL